MTTVTEPFDRPARESGALRRRLSRTWTLSRQNPMGAVGALIVIVLILVAIFADVLAPDGYTEQHLAERLHSPSLEEPFGTDHLGRSIFDRIVHGARISLAVALGATGFALAAATLIGVVSGYFGGWVDAIVQRFVDAWLAFPYLIILLSLAAIMGTGLENVIIALALAFTFGTSRVIRSAVIAIRSEAYVEAATVIGAHPLRVLRVHILPNVMAPIIVLGTLLAGNTILAEASLSFLGIGVPPPHPSWGGMLQAEARGYMTKAPWMAVIPGLAISLAIFGANMLGDALRDILDPRLRGVQH